ncbi:hypothetical protein HOC35_04235 [Candidatus Woesearchaeota archaeon]|nr:hypothetical protein [Candidatus Woesearchaeota archaeon]
MAKDKNFDELKEWLILFLKHKDLFYKKIVDIKEKDGILIVEQKENTQYFAILPHLDVVDKLLDDYKDKQICIVTFNTKPNFDIIINSWKKLSELPMLCIYFVNPNSSTEKKWIIYPFTHSKITEHSALKQGLMTLFESVEEYK